MKRVLKANEKDFGILMMKDLSVALRVSLKEKIL